MIDEKNPDETALLAVSTDSHEDSRRAIRYVEQIYGVPLTFPLLADTGHKVIGRYGLLNMGTATGPRTRKFATSSTLILDKEGRVGWRMVEENWKTRPTNELILVALDRVRRGEDASDVTLQSVAMKHPAGGVTVTAPAEERTADDMVLVPSGSFKMGGRGGLTLKLDASEHEVELQAYYIDKYEVTNPEYRLFVEYMEKTNDHSRCRPLEPGQKDHTPQYWNDPRYSQDDFPVVGVDWFDACAYCAWAGKTLPTEAQWERAARAGLEGQNYPWGDETDKSKANLARGAGEGGAFARDLGQADPDQELQNRSPKPVGSYQPNVFGLYDMHGNAEEWCWDWYSQGYYRQSPPNNPQGPNSGALKVVRGGSWHHGRGMLAQRYTHPPDQRFPFLGFRCVKAVSDDQALK